MGALRGAHAPFSARGSSERHVCNARRRTGQASTAGDCSRALISAFSGTTGLVVKIVLLSLIERVRGLGDLRAHRRGATGSPSSSSSLATVLLDFIYLLPRRWTLPLKFLVPGTVFLLGFQVIPILYTIQVAFTNYSTGHIATKSDAITQIKVTSLQPPANGRSYTMAAARDSSGNLVLILQDDTSRRTTSARRRG